MIRLKFRFPDGTIDEWASECVPRLGEAVWFRDQEGDIKDDPGNKNGLAIWRVSGVGYGFQLGAAQEVSVHLVEPENFLTPQVDR